MGFVNALYKVGGVATQSGTWAARPPSLPDGTYYQVTGKALYRYSSSFQTYVRPEVFAGSPVLDAHIGGDIEPDSESPVNWTETVGASCTLSSNGTIVTIDSNSAADSAQCYALYDHGTADPNVYFQGDVANTARAGASEYGEARGIFIDDNVKRYMFTLYLSAATPYACFSASGAVKGWQDSEDFTSEKFLELVLTKSGRGYAYADNEINPFAYVDYADLGASASSTIYAIGDATGVARGTTTARNVYVGRF